MHMISLVIYVQILSFVHVYFYQTHNCDDKCLTYTTTINVSSGIFGICCGSRQVKNNNTASTDSDICSILSFLWSSILVVFLLLPNYYESSQYVSVFPSLLCSEPELQLCAATKFSCESLSSLWATMQSNLSQSLVYTFVSSHFLQVQYIGTKWKQLNKK